MLKLEHIAKTFNPGTINEKHAIRDLSLELADGDFVTPLRAFGRWMPAQSSSAARTSPECRSISARSSSAAFFRIP